jgi:hypothetical protein
VTNTKIMKLRCDLTPAELQQKSMMLAEAINEHARVKAEASVRAKQFKDKLGGIQDEITELVEAIRHRSEERDVETNEIRDFDTNAVQTVRLDTHEVVSERPMESNERQQELELDTKAKTEELRSKIAAHKASDEEDAAQAALEAEAADPSDDDDAEFGVMLDPVTIPEPPPPWEAGGAEGSGDKPKKKRAPRKSRAKANGPAEAQA